MSAAALARATVGEAPNDERDPRDARLRRWLAHTADQGARFLEERGSAGIVAACEGFLLQTAAESIADRHDPPCWSRLDVDAYLAAVGGHESSAARAMAVTTLTAYYAWLVASAELSTLDARRVLDELAPSGRKPVRRRSATDGYRETDAVHRAGVPIADAAPIRRPGAHVPQNVFATRSSGLGSAA